MKPKYCYAAIVVLSLLVVGTRPALGTKYIRDDATGGDATSIGNWDWPTKTCTLTTNVTETIQIDSDGITLDGNGHTVTGSGAGAGVYLYQKMGVTIQNLTVMTFYNGIHLYGSSGNTLAGNTASSNNRHGIYIGKACSSNILTGNTIADNGTGIALKHTTHNTLTGNTVNSNNDYGIYLYGSNNTLTGNTISNNGCGISLRGYDSDNNQVYNNNFIDNGMQAYVSGGSGNLFNLAAPTGGNYWSDYTGVDTNGDGIGDTEIPYTFTGGEDYLPWVIQDGWDPLVQIEQLIAKVIDLDLQHGIENSLVSKLEAAINSLDRGQENATKNQLNAFINQVEAQRGNKISDADADALIAAVNDIIAMLSSP